MDYDTLAKSYNELHFEEQIKKLNIIKNHLIIKKQFKLLDIGCGTGISTNFFKRKSRGIDSSKGMIKQGKGNLICGKAEQLPFKDKYFDVILSVTAIHNFENQEKALDEILRVSKSDAQVVITLLKKSGKYNLIKSLIYKKLKVILEIEESKDTIFICKLGPVA